MLLTYTYGINLEVTVTEEPTPDGPTLNVNALAQHLTTMVTGGEIVMTVRRASLESVVKVSD